MQSITRRVLVSFALAFLAHGPQQLVSGQDFVISGEGCLGEIESIFENMNAATAKWKQ